MRPTQSERERERERERGHAKHFLKVAQSATESCGLLHFIHLRHRSGQLDRKEFGLLLVALRGALPAFLWLATARTIVWLYSVREPDFSMASHQLEGTVEFFRVRNPVPLPACSGL